MATNTPTTGEQNRNSSGELMDDDRQWPEDYREEIEREANSDGPHAWVCQRILDNMD